MSRWRLAVVGVLIAVPVLGLAGVGSWHLWQTGLTLHVWWPLFACASVGYFLAWYWLKRQQLVPPVDFTSASHWTERDKEAWKLVEARAAALAETEKDKTTLNAIEFYTNLAQDMALELARFYHPNAKDPFGSLTVPEILAVMELVSRDLAEMVDQNIPGSHLLSINDWKWTKDAAEKATDWYRKLANVGWVASAMMAPISTAMRYAATQAGATAPMQLFQQDLVAWLHRAYIQRLGNYLIELYSHRLRVGAQRYRELRGMHAAQVEGKALPGQAVELVTLTIMGQTKMGKSSFINGVLGAQQARVDVIPATDQVQRYELALKEDKSRLVLLDTVGYAHSGPRADQLAATADAAHRSDLLVLVLHARNPARAADLEMLQQLTAWFTARPDLKMPPMLAVVTHIDLLTPAMEWSPPYNWQAPQRPKEKHIAEALTAVREQLGDYLAGAVPVCTAAGKVYGIEEWFLPTVTELLGEARAVALLRCLRNEVDTAKVSKVVDQVVSIGKQALEIWAQSRVPVQK